MLDSLPDFLNNYWIYLMGAAVLCGALSYFSEKFFSYLKKALILFAVVFALAAAYELVTGKNIFTLPGRIEKNMADDPSEKETGHRYYKDYEERFGEKPPQ